MTAPAPAAPPSLPAALHQLDRDTAELDVFRAAIAAAVGEHRCVCRQSWYLAENATIDDYAALNRWLGRHEQCADEQPLTHVSMCPCGARLEIRGELDTDDYDALADFDVAHTECGDH